MEIDAGQIGLSEPQLRQFGFERFSLLLVISGEARNMAKRPANERVELEMKIMQYRQLMRRMTEEELLKRFAEQIAALERKLRETDQ
jgi:hypothetical protein